MQIPRLSKVPRLWQMTVSVGPFRENVQSRRGYGRTSAKPAGGAFRRLYSGPQGRRAEPQRFQSQAAGAALSNPRDLSRAEMQPVADKSTCRTEVRIKPQHLLMAERPVDLGAARVLRAVAIEASIHDAPR